MLLGDEEGAWRAGEECARRGGRPGRAPEADYVNWDYLTWNLPAWLDATVADAEANAGVGLGLARPAINRRHPGSTARPEAAELALKTTKEDPHDLTIAAMTHNVHGRLAARPRCVRLQHRHWLDRRLLRAYVARRLWALHAAIAAAGGLAVSSSAVA